MARKYTRRRRLWVGQTTARYRGGPTSFTPKRKRISPYVGESGYQIGRVRKPTKTAPAYMGSIKKPKTITFKKKQPIGSKYYPLTITGERARVKGKYKPKTQTQMARGKGSVKKTLTNTKRRHFSGSSDEKDLMSRSSSVHGTPKTYIPIKGTKYQVEQKDSASHPANNLPPSAPVVKSHDVKMKQMANASIMRRIHRTRVHTGMPATKAMMKIKQTFGSFKKYQFDSKFAYTSAGTRNTLTHSAGFNDTNFVMMPYNSWMAPNSILDVVTGWEQYVTPEDKAQKTYLSIEYLEQEIKFYNQSSYLPCIIKFFMIDRTSSAPDQPEGGIVRALSEETFNNVLATQTESAIPTRDQHSDIEVELIGFAGETRNVHLANRSRLTDSANFRTKFKILDTFSKKLEPGDTWVINHKHHCGPGLDLQSLIDSERGVNRNQFDPIAYQYAFSIKGIPCEAINQQEGTKRAHLGTSPAYTTMEFRKGMKAISNNDRTITDINANLGMRDNSVHIRTFTSNPYTIDSRKEFFELPENIVDTEAALVDNRSYIPIISDKVIVSGNTTPGQSDVDP